LAAMKVVSMTSTKPRAGITSQRGNELVREKKISARIESMIIEVFTATP
jgi:hypothetical protein